MDGVSRTTVVDAENAAANQTTGLKERIAHFDAQIGDLVLPDPDGAEAIKIALIADADLPREHLKPLVMRLAAKAGADATVMAKEVLRARDALEQVVRSGARDLGDGKPSSKGRNPLAASRPMPLDWVLDVVSRAIERQVVCSPHAVIALALWIVGTFGFEEATIFPRIAITSPTKRCGKSTLLAAMRAFVSRPVKADSISASAFFRMIQSRKPTLLIDEVDTFVKQDDSFRGVLNAGYERTGVVWRSVPTPDGKNFVPAEFSVYTPVALAGIGGLPDTVLDRSIIIRLQRAVARGTGGTRKTPIRHRALEKLGGIVAPHLVAHAAAIGTAMSVGVSAAIPALSDRAMDNWEPLLAIADLVGGAWPQNASAAAIALSGTQDQPSVRELLLDDLRLIVTAERDACATAIRAWRRGGKSSSLPLKVQRLRSADIVSALRDMEHRPWPEYGRDGKGITAVRLATLLKPFGIEPSTQRMPSQAQGNPTTVVTATVRTYSIATLRATFRQYLS